MRLLPLCALILALGCTTELSYTDSPGGGSGTGPDAGLEPDAYCAQIPVELSQETPTVVFLVDRSSAMGIPLGAGTAFDALYNSLFHFENGLVTQIAADVRFGLSLYSGQTGNPNCPIMSEVSPRLDGASWLSSLYSSTALLQNNPIGDAIVDAIPKLGSLSEPGPKIIVLATAGQPDTCAAPGAFGAPQAVQHALDATAAAYDAGIRTLVIGVGSQVPGSFLQSMADAGSGGNGAAYAHALDPAGLDSAVSDTVAGATKCSFAMDRPISQDSAGDAGLVTLNGRELLNGSEWTVSSTGALQLLGSACEDAKAGSVELAATFSCEAVGN